MNQEFFHPAMKFRCHFPDLMLETAQSPSSTACATTFHLLQPWGKGLSSKRRRIPLVSQNTLSKFKHLKFYSYQQTVRPIGAAEVTSDRQHIGQSSNREQAFNYAWWGILAGVAIFQSQIFGNLRVLRGTSAPERQVPGPARVLIRSAGVSVH
jgi:hypothetical protein